MLVTTFQKSHIPSAVELDARWFGDYGATPADFEQSLASPSTQALALLADDDLIGFAVFDVLLSDQEVGGYEDLITNQTTTFIQQFTTALNYQIDNWKYDTFLLKGVESLARKLSCAVIWEALSKDHPYAQNNNKNHDAYGFYEWMGYEISPEHTISWQQKIPCNLIYKKI